MLGFVAVVFVVIVLIHLYLWKRLIKDTLRSARGRRIGGVVSIVAALLVPATLIGVRTGAVTWLAWPGYLWLALMFYLLVTLAVLEIPRLAVRLWWRRTSPAPVPAGATAAAGATGTAAGATAAAGATGTAAGPGESAAGPGSGEPADAPPTPGVDRRLVLARGAAIFAGLTAAGVTGYGVRTALGDPQVNRLQIPLAKLPRTADGTRMVVVSDIHLGPLTGTRHAGRIVDVINSLDADVVCIVGDLVDGSVAELGRFAAPLAGIESRRGAYFVTGNHEYFSGAAEWVAEVDRLGVRPLRNQRVELAGLDLAGVNDYGAADYGDAADYGRALGDRDPARPVVLMAHQPRAVHEAAPYGVDLQVSGHTHGGQMAPFNLFVPLQQPVTSGLGTVDGVPVFVTNGAGFWGPPVRVGAPPQVSLIELRTR